MKRKRKPGRPPAENPRDDQVRIRCTSAEKAEWFRAAGGAKAFSAWARAVLTAAAGTRTT